MRTAGPAVRATWLTAGARKPLTDRLRTGTSVRLAAATLGGREAGRLSRRMVLSLSVKTTAPPLRRCDQPSGTLTLKPRPGTAKRTKAWLSGMSPGGFFSGALGLGLLELEPPQAVRLSAASSPAAVAYERGAMAADRRPGRSAPCARQVNARSKLVPARAGGRNVSPVVDPAILVVEDDDASASALARVLDSHGYAVRRVDRGRPALAAAGEDVGLVILDLGLPDMDGIDVCRRLRVSRPELAILILSARDQELDVVAGLDAGADDYLVKPFRLSELLARVRAHLRRADASPQRSEELAAGAIRLDVAARRARRGKAELELRPKEFGRLTLLGRPAGRVVTRERIMADV